MARELNLDTPAFIRSRFAWLLPTLVVLFFLTGMSGLIYQVLWLRLLSLVFGVTTWAASTVLASFMGGLALGSFLAGRFVDRARRPLMLYGVAEILVGLTALASPTLLTAVERLYVSLYPALPDSLAALTLARLVLSFAVLIIPTTLMGATLPIIIKSSLLQAEGLGERVSLLYATNTAGAIVGTLLAGFYLIGSVGMEASFLLAAGINIVVGVVSLLASMAVRGEAPMRAPAPSAHATPTPPKVADAVSNRARRAVLFVFTLSGFATLALEIIWFRILVLFFPVTTYAFTIMLATVLTGIAVGSYLMTPLMRRRLPWLSLLACLEIIIGLTSLLSLITLAYGGSLQTWLDRLLVGRPFLSQLASTVGVSTLAILPTTLLWGMAFPVGVRLYAGGDDETQADTGERIGLFYSLNVAGAILGSIAAGFLLLPWLGLQNSLIAIAAVSLASGLLLLMVMDGSDRARSRVQPITWVTLFVGVMSGLVFAGLAAAVPNPFTLSLTQRYPGHTLLWQEEGVQTTVTVQQKPEGHRVLYLDGMGQASDEPDLVVYHHLLGHIPMALHPNPRHALIVGLGGGATAGAVSQHGKTQIDVAELSGGVVRGAEWFKHINFDVLRQPNVRLRVDDGRNYLLLTNQRYDVITADIIFPVHAGAGALYSAEYFALARRALNDDGLMLQWIHPGRDSQYRLIMRTFLSVFPDATLWNNGSMMIGSKKPLKLDRADFERKLQDPATAALMQRIGFPTFEKLLEQYWGGPDDMRRFVGDGPILTDNQPRVEYFLSLPREDPPVDVSLLHNPNRPPIKD